MLALALIKGQMVGDWLMGLRIVRGTWRWVVAVWLPIPGALIALTFSHGYGR